MKLIKLENMEQFRNLKVGDLIIVEWDDYFVKHHDCPAHRMAYNICALQQTDQLEVICQIKDNHYFAAERYLEGLSQANAVWKLEVTDGPRD